MLRPRNKVKCKWTRESKVRYSCSVAEGRIIGIDQVSGRFRHNSQFLAAITKRKGARANSKNQSSRTASQRSTLDPQRSTLNAQPSPFCASPTTSAASIAELPAQLIREEAQRQHGM